MKYSIDKMKCLDMYVNSLSDDEYLKLKDRIHTSDENIVNLVSLDLHLQNFNALLQNATIQNDLFSLNTFAKKLRWKNNIEKILTNNSFEALVLTDINRTILWVNDGFATMTGFSKKDAIHNTPSFLQGSSTSKVTRARIREKLKMNQPFKEVIVNHRKDNTTYKCELHIFPLYNEETTHFLALERRIA
ncbi:PAS domain-containing protein [Tenacibaculum amylolyticum]|uniref:PAS domain-containing protein n=1 Tax=Tenacibaculum amylolyticum TaxID=104269 RepID=UPI003896166B